MYLSDKVGGIGNKKAKHKTLRELTEKNHLQLIGPANPNRKKLGDTRVFGLKKRKEARRKLQKRNLNNSFNVDKDERKIYILET